MTAHRCQPKVYELADGSYVVRHTHNLDLATQLLNDHLNQPWDGTPRAVWYRAINCAPGTRDEAQGWDHRYHYALPGSRGAFRAVEFKP